MVKDPKFMTKKELIEELTKLDTSLNNSKRNARLFKDQVKTAIINALENTCSDAAEYIEDFCSDIDMTLPTRTVTVEVELPYGREVGRVEDDDCNELAFME